MIELKKLTKIYKTDAETVNALNSIDLDISSGQFLSIMGQSGSGKTTLMNILGCLDNPSSGKYLINGLDVSSLSDDQRARLRGELFGFVFQSYNLIPRMSALEQVELPLMYQIENKDRKLKAAQALESVGLVDRMHFNPNQLSGGQQQRVAIARSLVVDPQVILADEPTGALDSNTGEEIMAIFRELVEIKGITVILVTHELHIAEFASRVITLKDGLIISDKKV
ncbi:MAG: macrolide ABC transporter ATP-binding protein [Chloroflexi bacterium]|nr:macrolide ABC transporter ATP-binding protein [Chloroflexota bacterium]